MVSDDETHKSDICYQEELRKSKRRQQEEDKYEIGGPSDPWRNTRVTSRKYTRKYTLEMYGLDHLPTKQALKELTKIPGKPVRDPYKTPRTRFHPEEYLNRVQREQTNRHFDLDENTNGEGMDLGGGGITMPQHILEGFLKIDF